MPGQNKSSINNVKLHYRVTLHYVTETLSTSVKDAQHVGDSHSLCPPTASMLTHLNMTLKCISQAQPSSFTSKPLYPSA